MLRLRVLLFWLLAFAVPLQGFAAATRLLCDGSHGAQHSHAGGSHGGVHGHDQHDAAPDGDDHAVAALPTVDGTTHQCGLCAACCHTVAIAHTYEPVFAPAGSHGRVAERPTRMPSLGLGLPDKPPRIA